MPSVKTLEGHLQHGAGRGKTKTKSKAGPAIEFAHQAERLGQYTADQETDDSGSTHAVEARFITAQDPVVVTANGGRLPAVPIEEAVKLNELKDKLDDLDPARNPPLNFRIREAKDGTVHGVRPPDNPRLRQSSEADAPLKQAIAPASTNPMFPPLPTYGPPSLMRSLQSRMFRFTSAILSSCFLLVIILGAFSTSVPLLINNFSLRVRLRDPDEQRPFNAEEKKLSEDRKRAEAEWEQQTRIPRKRERRASKDEERPDERAIEDAKSEEDYVPTEGGPDPLICDVGYYARRVGLDCETFLVQTEDGFIIELWHIYNPLRYERRSSTDRSPQSPDLFTSPPRGSPSDRGDSKYPVLLMHGLLQSSGAYCSNDDNSLAFFLAKSGLNVWLGNNRCGFTPRHTLLRTADPRMWAWNIRQMGVMDLPALISRVLQETGFSKLALVAHSQGTTQTMVALAKEQRPEIGDKISVVCLLAPAAYAGPLIEKMYFKFMRVISPGMFRAMFGIHSFIPFMMKMHSLLPGKFYGFMGYRVFSFLFNWTDTRWDRGVRDRCFQFAPVYVSAESMRWWLGRECFARQKCILSTKQESRMENQEDAESDEEEYAKEHGLTAPNFNHPDRGRFAWYDEQCPPIALWVCGSDDLVDGKRLLRRFERGREPHVEIVYSTIIEGYEHLDVIWAIDSIEKVGKPVLETIWRTMPEKYRDICGIPTGCEGIEPWKSRKGGVIDNDIHLDKENGLETTDDTSAGAEKEQ